MENMLFSFFAAFQNYELKKKKTSRGMLQMSINVNYSDKYFRLYYCYRYKLENSDKFLHPDKTNFSETSV